MAKHLPTRGSSLLWCQASFIHVLAWLLLLIGLPSNLSAQTTFEYTYEGQTVMYAVLTDSTCAVTRKSGSGYSYINGELILPPYPEFEGRKYALTEIEQRAFMNVNNLFDSTINGLTSVILPNTLKVIGEFAFQGNYGLTSITIPNSVTTIGRYAFSMCMSLTNVSLPDSLSEIPERLFSECHSLSNITIPPTVTYIGSEAFFACVGFTDIEIPQSVQYIEERAFRSCSNLRSIIIPSKLKSIGNETFLRCTALSSIYYLADVPISTSESLFEKSVYDSATLYLSESALKNLSQFSPWSMFTHTKMFDSSAIKEHSKEFEYTYAGQTIKYRVIDEDALTCEVAINKEISGNVKLPSHPMSGNKEYTLISTGTASFAGCQKLESVVIPTSVNEIGDLTFLNCSNLTDVIIPASVITIGNSAFQSCRKLSQLLLPKSIESIGSNAYLNCSGLKSVIIPNSVISIEDAVFAFCRNLEVVYLPSSVQSLSYWAFNYCVKVVSVYYNTTKPIDIKGWHHSSEATLYIPSAGLEVFDEYPDLHNFKNKTAWEAPVEIEEITFNGATISSIDMNIGENIMFNISATPINAANRSLSVVIHEGDNIEISASDIDGEGQLTITALSEGRATVIISATDNSGSQAILNIRVKPEASTEDPFDISGDGKVDVTDVVNLVDKIIHKTTDTATQDLNGDGRVDVSDIVLLVSHILRGNAHKSVGALSRSAQEVPMSFEMSRACTAMQTDIVVAKGTRIEDVAINAAIARSHTLAYREIEPGHYRVIIYSLANRTMDLAAGEPLFSLAMTGDSSVSTEFTIFVEAQPATTAIDGIGEDGAAVESVSYFDLQGRRVSLDATGILIERTVLTDGRALTRKIRR